MVTFLGTFTSDPKLAGLKFGHAERGLSILFEKLWDKLCWQISLAHYLLGTVGVGLSESTETEC
jgi:hypothetical protein